MNAPTISKKWEAKNYLLLLLVTLLTYWPLSLNYLSLKNDALVQYLAFRYQLSEAVQNGFAPLWNPYLYTGFPIHADMQGEVWNPIVLFLSILFRYDMTVLQWEVLIYLFLCAAGMYRLMRYLKLSVAVAFCCGVSYMACGYVTDSVSVIPWVASAAFIPFAIIYFLKLIRQTSLPNAIKFSFALALLFVCGYPSFFIFLNYLFATSFVIVGIGQLQNGNRQLAVKTILHLGLAYLLFALLCSPAIISYYEFLPYYSRGSGIAYEKAASNPFPLFSLASYFIPNIANKAGFLTTDISMRNAYSGMAVLLFFIAGFFSTHEYKKAIIAFSLFSFLFSLGAALPVQQLSYDLLPLLDTFRHPGTMRVFTTIGIIWLAAFALEEYFKERKKKYTGIITILVAILLLAAVVFFYIKAESLNFVLLSVNAATLKTALQNLSFYQFGFAMAVLQFVSIIAFMMLHCKTVSHKNFFVALFALNSIGVAWAALPFTVVSQYKTASVNQYLNSFKQGYPLPKANDLVEAAIISDSVFISPHGYQNFYNKKITVQDHIITPTLNLDYENYLQEKLQRQKQKEFPLVYFTDQSNEKQSAEIIINHFTPNSFVITTNTKAPGQLHLFQQYNANWQVTVNGRVAKVEKSNKAFMSVAVARGLATVKWMYKPVAVLAGLAVSMAVLLLLLFYFLLRKKTIVGNE